MKEKLLNRIPIKVFIVVCLFLASFFLFAFIADEAVLEKDSVFDDMSRTFFTKHSTPGLVQIMRGITYLGSAYFLLPAYLMLIAYFAVKKNTRRAIDIAIVSSSSYLVTQGMKHLFRRVRPESAILEGLTNYSFPSGHSLSAFVFCGIIAYLVCIGRLAGIRKLLLVSALLLVAVTVGVSRIVLGAHYATDAIAGCCLGMVWLILSFWVLRKFRG